NELSLNDIRDATGELANIAGGTIRTLRAPNSALSLPSVALGHDFEFTLSQGKVVQAASFLTPSGVLTISIIEKEAPRQPLRVASPPQ
ncbi:MAG TPA: hypothetical protein VL240_03885, partial [Candidatus Binatia bacterium]|nr:hypothetical protein [Candidatus Binatia bacterium]